MVLLITSLQNPRIKEAVKLRERRKREETGTFLIEGYRELSRAVAARWEIETLFYCPEFFLGSNESSLIELILGEKFCCNEAVFEKLSYRDRPDGLLAVARQQRKMLEDLPLSKNPFLLVAESIEKPGNLGTILRSADAVGVDGLIIADPNTDLFNPNVVRASVGTLFHVPVVSATTEETLRFLEEKKITVLSATPQAEKNFTKEDCTIPLAIVVGSEQYGLTKPWFEATKKQVRIPMKGMADSLNVSAATTLLLYEVLRQRTDSLCR